MTPVHILLLGDCTVATPYLPLRLRNETRLRQRLAQLYGDTSLLITNEGLESESIAGFLRRYERTLRRYPAPDYVLIRYGVNDRRQHGAEVFAANLDILCHRLLADYPDTRIVLETGIYVDYPNHYAWDRNTVLQPIYDAIRAYGRRCSLPVVDIYERMKRETERGNWDLRVRGFGVVEDVPVLGPGQDHMHGHDVRWFTNIHPNPRGVDVIADEEAHVFAAYWPHSLRVHRAVAAGPQPNSLGSHRADLRPGADG